VDSHIIDLIVQEVLLRINKSYSIPSEEKGTLAIVCSQVTAPQMADDTLQNQFADIRYAIMQTEFTASGIQKLAEEDLLENNLMTVAAQSENIVLIAPPIWLLEKIAKGDDNGPVEQLMLRTILWGKKVHILLDFDIPRFRRNTLFEKLADITAALTDMSVGIIQYCCVAGVKNEALSLVTEQEVLAAYKQKDKRIICASDAIITPAARDKAEELKIKIDR